jgi:hypothetical protein
VPFYLPGHKKKLLKHGINWYEDRQPALGDRFLKEVISRIRKIEQTPYRYPT